jgi:hypothetical protein
MTIKRIYKGMILSLIKEKDFKEMLIKRYGIEESDKILKDIKAGKMFKTKDCKYILNKRGVKWKHII